ncbi:MAG: TonB-dependent receptor, partial [Porticoccaceae bacterium]|nr:TonB-dependent receptor [Porticoccaceae bacterium]
MTTQYSFFKRNRLAVAMAAVMCLPAVAHAGEGKPVEINIDAAPASVVLLKLAEASGAQIVFSQDIGNLTLPAIRGEHTLESALELVLEESGLEYEMLSEDSVVIKAGSGSDSSGDGQTREVDEEVVITGSRISRDVASGRTVSPVTVITGDDMAKQGFGTVADALSSVSAVTGQTEFNDFLSSQAPTARPVNLRGFGPGRTLILINGQRIASYPIPAGGGNFANTAQIPAAAVERVEILSGGASAIYGSDAVAGVINIITKEELDQTSISVRASGTQDGGASDRRVQFTSGVNADNWNLTYGLEYSERNPLRLSNRAWSDSYADAPNIALTANERERLSVDGEIQTFFPGAVAVPTQASCAALGLQFVPSSFNEVDNSGRGAACVVGTDAAPPGVLLPETDSYSAFAGWRYDINDDLQLKLRASYWSSETAHDPGFMEASARADLGFGVFPVGVRRFFSAEAGNINTLFDEETMDFSAQLSGRWDKFFYEINMVHSAADFESRRRVFLRSFETALGSNFLAAHTPQTLAQSVGVTQRNGESESSSVNMIVSGELFDLPAGPAKFASIAEYTRETIRDGLDARSVAGDFAGVGATSGQSGRRGHIALGAELILPVSDTLTVPLAARYDKYNDITQVDDAITYSLGLEYRPVDRLLVRALMSTSFRAPDMEAVYRATTVDRFRFRNYADCHNAGVASYNE